MVASRAHLQATGKILQKEGKDAPSCVHEATIYDIFTLDSWEVLSCKRICHENILCTLLKESPQLLSDDDIYEATPKRTF